MPNIRDLVAIIRQRPGVEAAIVLGRDGLVIDSQAVPQLDAEQVAAHIPPIIHSGDEFGAAAMRGALQTVVMEHPGGVTIVSALSEDAVLLVLAQPTADLGALLYELRRNREQMAALV